MKFSFGSKNEVEQSLTISVTDEEIEKQVKTKLNSAQKSVKIKGFRQGKAPLNLVKKMYEPEIRQDVINDAVVKKFYEQVKEKDLKPVGRPNMIPERIEREKDVIYKATFEIYPEIKVNNLSRLNYTKTKCSVTKEDVEKTRQKCKYEQQ